MIIIYCWCGKIGDDDEVAVIGTTAVHCENGENRLAGMERVNNNNNDNKRYVIDTLNLSS